MPISTAADVARARVTAELWLILVNFIEWQRMSICQSPGMVISCRTALRCFRHVVAGDYNSCGYENEDVKLQYAIMSWLMIITAVNGIITEQLHCVYCVLCMCVCHVLMMIRLGCCVAVVAAVDCCRWWTRCWLQIMLTLSAHSTAVNRTAGVICIHWSVASLKLPLNAKLVSSPKCRH